MVDFLYSQAVNFYHAWKGGVNKKEGDIREISTYCVYRGGRVERQVNQRIDASGVRPPGLTPVTGTPVFPAGRPWPRGPLLKNSLPVPEASGKGQVPVF